MNKRTVIFILKVVVAVATAILSVLGVSAFSSCASRARVQVNSRGIGVFQYVDTIKTYRSVILDSKKDGSVQLSEPYYYTY